MMRSLLSFNRFQAAGLHFLGSVLVAVISAALVFLVWYPGVLALASGVTAIFLMMLGVDVVLGPCITAIVFNPVKKELRRDLLIVLLVQLSALGYGLHTVWVARPVYAVFNVDRFDLVFANDLSDEKLARASEHFQYLPWLRPKFIAARRPETSRERSDLLFQSLAGGDDLPQIPEYYVPYADKQAEAAKRARPLAALRGFNQSNGPVVDALVARHAAAEAGFLPLKGKVQDLVVVVSLKDGTVLELVDLAPW